jgi:sporulation protein YlmC with PRC-barrel domain
MLKRLVMMTKRFALALTPIALFVTSASAQNAPKSQPLKAEQVIGMKVENSDGQELGTVRNLVLDMRTGQLKYAALSSGGFLGVRSKLKLVPSQALSAATAKRDVLAINVTKERWDAAPVFKSSNLAAFADPNRSMQIAQFYRQPDAHAMSLAENSRIGPERLTPTARAPDLPSRAPGAELKFASDLIGSRVVNGKQEKVGEILDLLVSFGEARPAYAIISTGKFLRRGAQYAVPLRALNTKDGGNTLVIDADTAKLQKAPPFSDEVWRTSAANGPNQIYRYLRTEN